MACAEGDRHPRGKGDAPLSAMRVILLDARAQHLAALPRGDRRRIDARCRCADRARINFGRSQYENVAATIPRHRLARRARVLPAMMGEMLVLDQVCTAQGTAPAKPAPARTRPPRPVHRPPRKRSTANTCRRQPPVFGGVINMNAADSKPWWPPRSRPPRAPNVLLIMTDDVGFGARAPSAASFPRRPWIASPRWGCATRSFIPRRCARPRGPALITGRNHHSVGFGVVAEMATGFPGYDSIIGTRFGDARPRS